MRRTVFFNYKHLDELPVKIISLFLYDEKRKSITETGRKKAFKYHIWKDRALIIISLVDMCKMTKQA